MSEINLFLLKDFVSQASEHLDSFKKNLQSLVLGEANQSLYKSLYAPLFAMQSAARFIGLAHTTALTLALSDLMELLDRKALPINVLTKKVLLKCPEMIMHLLEELSDFSAEKTNSDDLVGEIRLVIAQLKTVSLTGQVRVSASAHTYGQDTTQIISTGLLETLSGDGLVEQVSTAKQLLIIGNELTHSKQYQPELFSIFNDQMKQRFAHLLALIYQPDIEDQKRLEQTQEQLQVLSNEASDMGATKLTTYFLQWQKDLTVAYDSQLEEPLIDLAIAPLNDLLKLFGFNLDDIQLLAQPMTLVLVDAAQADTTPFEMEDLPTQIIEPFVETDESFLETGIYASDMEEEEATYYPNSGLVDSIAELQELCAQCDSLQADPETIRHFKRTLDFLYLTAKEENCKPLEKLCVNWTQQIDLRVLQQQSGKEVSWSFMSGFIAKMVKMTALLSTGLANETPIVSQQEMAPKATQEIDEVIEKAFDETDLLTQRLNQTLVRPELNESLEDMFDEMFNEGHADQTDKHETQPFTLDKAHLDNLQQQLTELYRGNSYLVQFDQQLKKMGNIKSLHKQLEQANHLLQKTTQQLHETMRTMREVPVEFAVKGLEFLARQLAEKQSKQVSLLIKCDDFKIDRDLLEALKPCLTELIRNAVEHGIEKPIIRQRLQKKIDGTIHITLSKHQHILLLSVQDDGHGLYLEKIKHKALAQNLMPPEEMSKLTQSAIYPLILKPGLSTVPDDELGAERGMGLVAVERHVKQQFGHIQLFTQPGQFSRVELSLPLLPMMLKAVQFKLARNMYLVPYIALVKILKLEDRHVFEVENQAQIFWQDQALPLYYLDRLLAVADTQSQVVLVLQLNDEKIGLVVNKVVSLEEVALHASSNNEPLLSQAMLKNGRVSGLINLVELARRVTPE